MFLFSRNILEKAIIITNFGATRENAIFKGIRENWKYSKILVRRWRIRLKQAEYFTAYSKDVCMKIYFRPLYTYILGVGPYLQLPYENVKVSIWNSLRTFRTNYTYFMCIAHSLAFVVRLYKPNLSTSKVGWKEEKNPNFNAIYTKTTQK